MDSIDFCQSSESILARQAKSRTRLFLIIVVSWLLWMCFVFAGLNWLEKQNHDKMKALKFSSEARQREEQERKIISRSHCTSVFLEKLISAPGNHIRISEIVLEEKEGELFGSYSDHRSFEAFKKLIDHLMVDVKSREIENKFHMKGTLSC